MDNLIALVPSIGVGLLFVLVIRYFLRADRIEREAMADLDRSETPARTTSAEGAPGHIGNAGSPSAVPGSVGPVADAAAADPRIGGDTPESPRAGH